MEVGMILTKRMQCIVGQAHVESREIVSAARA